MAAGCDPNVVRGAIMVAIDEAQVEGIRRLNRVMGNDYELALEATLLALGGRGL